MTTHIDTLNEWWENAEPTGDANPAKVGDLVMWDRLSGGYQVETVGGLLAPVHSRNLRILHRAPKPAWHDAVAIIATYRDDCGMVSGVWTPEGKPGYWEGPEGDVIASERLEDVTPLIEAKVTDEMVQRFVDADRGGNLDITVLLAAALGIDPE